jgi:hypothetical protein
LGAALATTSARCTTGLRRQRLEVREQRAGIGRSHLAGTVNIVSTVTGEKNDSPGLILLLGWVHEPRRHPATRLRMAALDQ